MFMETKKLTIICVTIIVILLIVVGAVVLTSMNAKQDSKVKITSNKTMYEGGTLKVKLTDLNKTPIVNENINVTINDKNGKQKVKKTLKTNSKGVAKLKLDLKKGKYTVNAAYGGNENYTENSTSQKLTIKEKVKKATKTSPAVTYQKYSPQFGTYVNEYTDSNGVQHIDGANGMRVSYDPSTGVETFDDGNGYVESTYMG